MNRTLGALFSVLLLLVVGGAVGAHLRATRPVRPTPRAAPTAPHQVTRPADRLAAELRDTTLVVRRRGQKQLEVHADRVSLSSDQRYAVFSGIVRASLNLHGRVALSLRATEVVLDRQRNDLRIRGPLEITSAQGYRLTAPEASWDAAQGLLVLPRGLEMEAGGSTIRAGRLTVDLASESLLLEGDVQVTFPLAGGGP
jgi:lipopolysaccharide export system protein LptA